VIMGKSRRQYLKKIMRKVNDEIILNHAEHVSVLKHIFNQYSIDIAVQQYGDPKQEMMMCRNCSGIDKHNELIFTKR